MTTKTPSAPRTTAPAPATSAFARRADVGRAITRETIDAHLAAFEAAGGVVEVLGNTPLHKPWRAAGRGPAKPAA